jgi:hypothetical protein
MSTVLTPTVQAAITEIRETFHPARVSVEADGQGGARIAVERAPLGAPFSEVDTWIGAHLPAQLPYSDVYPLFVRGDLRRVDGAALTAPLATGHTFMGRPAVQISRRSTRVDLASQTPSMKLLKTLYWMRSNK